MPTAPKAMKQKVVHMNQEIFKTIQEAVSEVIGIEPEETTMNTYLDEYHLELPRVIKKINDHYKIELSTKDVLDECEIVADLVGLVEDEAEYESVDDDV